MNDSHKQKLAQRQRALVESQVGGDDAAPAEEVGPPSPPPRPFEEMVIAARPDVPAGMPVSFLRFNTRSFQVPGMQSGETLKAAVASNGQEHRIEYIPQMRHHLVTFLVPALRKVEVAFVHESNVMNWTPA